MSPQQGVATNTAIEQRLISSIKALSPQEVVEVQNFVEFLATKSRKRAALDRFLGIAPALEAADVTPIDVPLVVPGDDDHVIALAQQVRGRTTRGFVMTVIESRLMERLKKLPPSRVAEVYNFIDFLASQEGRSAAAQRLTEGLARIDALGLPAISEDEVEEEVQAARRARCSQQDD